MKKNYAKPTWKPTIVPDIRWTTEHLSKYLGNKRFTMFENGTCVVWPDSQELSQIDCEQSLLSVVANSPDFKVRRSGDGDFLVTFKGGVGGIVPSSLLSENFSILRTEALSMGKLPSETFQCDVDNDQLEIELVAGLYVRARLYLDVEGIMSCP